MNSSKQTGSGVLSFTLDTDSVIRLHESRLHLDNGSSLEEEFTITLDSSLGSEYDVVLTRHLMQNVDDLVCDFDDMWFLPNDKLVFSWPNSDGRTWGLEIKFIPAC